VACSHRPITATRAADFSIVGSNVVIHLREPVTLTGLVGRRRTTRVIRCGSTSQSGLLG
jgi:hypothetical protein